MIYLDNNATTLPVTEILEAMLEGYKNPYNPSSPHAMGRKAKSLLINARESIAKNLGCSCKELIFTSGGSEGMNMCIKGLYKGGRILTTRIEHSCVLKAIQDLPVDYVDVGPYGAPTPEAIEEAITPETSLLVFSSANGETGVMIDLEQIAALAEKHKLPLIIDGVAHLGRAPLTLYSGITAMVFSAHKIHGPKGTGLVYLRRGSSLKPLILGGGQESNLRAGTENLPAILGFAKAIDLIDPSHFSHMEDLRKTFEDTLLAKGAKINGEGPRASNVSNIYFPDTDGEALLMQLDQKGICASHGSACSSGALEPSHVLTNMGYAKDRVLSSLRFSLSRTTTKQEIQTVLKEVL